MKIVTFILAAGKCERFGLPKFLLPIENNILIKKILKETNGVFDEVFIISGFYDNLLRKFIDNKKFPILYNQNYEQGMSSSIKIGVNFARKNKFDGICIIPSDMPFISKDILKVLKDNFEKNHFDAVSFCKGNSPIPPVIFSKNTFKDLNSIKGDKGAKSVLQKLTNKKLIKGYEEYLIDIDTPQDYLHIVKFFS